MPVWRLRQPKSVRRHQGESGSAQMVKPPSREPADQREAGPPRQKPLPADLPAALAELRAVLEPCGDVAFRSFTLGTDPPAAAAVVFCKPLVDARSLSEQVLETLMLHLTQAVRAQPAPVPAGDLCAVVEQMGLPLGDPKSAATVDAAVDEILKGSVALLVHGCPGAWLVEMRAELGRDVTEPETEGSVRGPREGFTEILEANMALLRRRLPVPEFRVERYRLGRRTRTEVSVAYLEGVPRPGVVAEVRRRLEGIRIDGVLDSAYIEELIEDAPVSPFPTIDHTERPDKATAALLEGRVAILTSGSPFALVLPVTFTQFLQSAEDYYERYFLATGLRLIRYLAFFLALTLPAFYVAVTTYHHEMIPSALFISLAAQREGVPFPAIGEALLMEVAFELLREAGIRLPRPVGQAVSIIGGVVIGEAAIRARIASAGMVIVVATTGISSFAIPAFSLAITLRLLRFPLMILGATLGLHGVVVGLLILLIHMAGLRSFGVPYLSPLAPAKPGDWKDLFLRVPWWKMDRRPASLELRDRGRAARGQMPRRGGR